jgi:hypothetical protein
LHHKAYPRRCPATLCKWRPPKLVESLSTTRLSKSQVSDIVRDLDEQMEAFRIRPLDAGPYTFVAAEALVLKVRECGRSVAAFVKARTMRVADSRRKPSRMINEHNIRIWVCGSLPSLRVRSR